MIEILDIIVLFGLFVLFTSGPLNLFNLQQQLIDNNKRYSSYFNLILNLNILLILSILPLNLSSYIYLFYLILFLFLIRNLSLYFPKNKTKKFDFIFIIFFIMYLIISIDISDKLDLSWDAKWFWYIKSLFFYQDNSLKELASYQFNDFHPHLGSYIWAFFRKVSIYEYEYYGRLFYVFLYLSSLLFITKDLLKKNMYNVLIFLVVIIVNYKYYYLSGIQEVLLFSLLIFISKFIFNYLDSKNFLYLFFVGLALNLILWIKAEGIAFFLITIICINFIKKLKLSHRIKFNLFLLLLVVFKIIIFKIFDIKLNNQPYYIEYLSSLNFEILIFKIKNILLYLLYNSFKNLIFILFPIILIIQYKLILKNEFLKINFIFYLLNLSFIFLAYIFRDMEVGYSLKTTIDRIVFSSSGFYLFYVINYLKNLFSKFN